MKNPRQKITRLPRTILLLGNGFSMDHVEYSGLGHLVKLAPNDLMPARDHVHYLPAIDTQYPDRFCRQHLWNREIVGPELWEAWHEYEGEGGDFLQFCADIARQGRVNFGSPGAWSYCNKSVGFQLRVYLWNLFKYYDDKVGKYIFDYGFGNWIWPKIIKSLLENTRLLVISYNYDCVVETVLTRLKNPPYVPVKYANDFNWDDPETPHPWCLKPHGCIASLTSSGVGMGPNPTQGLVVVHNLVNHSEDEVKIKYPPNQCPPIPDLVPPGHCVEHVMLPTATVRNACENAIQNCDLIISCGLAGASPDDVEITSLLSKLPAHARRIQVGLESSDDRNNTVGRLLSNCDAKKYTFFDAKDVHRLNDSLMKLIVECDPQGS